MYTLLWLSIALPVCPRSRFNETIVSYAPSGTPCGDRVRCQNAFLPGALGRHCWHHPDDPAGATYCLQQKTQVFGDPCWLFPAPSPLPPQAGQCADGMYCWVSQSITVQGNQSAVDTTGRGYCLSLLEHGLPCTYHTDCKGWCRELSMGIKACAPEEQAGSACIADMGCASGMCFEGTCVEVSKAGELCDRNHRCSYSLDCINSLCGYHAVGTGCNPSIPPYGGCAPHHYCDGNLTQPVCRAMASSCNVHYNSCEPGEDCDAGVCAPLGSKGLGSVTSHVKFCEYGLFLDTSTAVHVCASSKPCTQDADCELGGPAELAYCKCDAVSDVGRCVMAAGDSVCVDMPTHECCSIKSMLSNCTAAFQQKTSVFGSKLGVATVEPSPLWCNERCVTTPQCTVWTYRTTTKACTLGTSPYEVMATSETVGDISSEVLHRCTTTSAYDYTVPGMEVLCPVDAKHDGSSLIEVPAVPAHPGLPYMLRRRPSLEPLTWYSDDVDLTGASWLTALDSEVLWVPEAVLTGGRAYTFGVESNTTRLDAVSLHVVEAPVVVVTANGTHVRFCNSFKKELEYRVYVTGALVASGSVCTYERGPHAVLLCVADSVARESCSEASITLHEDGDEDLTSLASLGRRYLTYGIENITADLLVMAEDIEDTGAVPLVSGEEVAQYVSFLRVVDEPHVALQALETLLSNMTTRMPLAVGKTVLAIVGTASSAGSAQVTGLLRLALLRHSRDKHPTQLYATGAAFFVHRSLEPSTDKYIAEHVPHVSFASDLLLPLDVTVLTTTEGVLLQMFTANTATRYPLPVGYPVHFRHLVLPTPVAHPSVHLSGVVMLLTLEDISAGHALDAVSVASGVSRTLLHVVDTKGPQVLLYSEDAGITAPNISNVEVMTDDYQLQYPCPWPQRAVAQNITCVRDGTQLGCETVMRRLRAVQTGELRVEYECKCRYLTEHPVNLEYLPTLLQRPDGVEHFLSQKRVHTVVFPVALALLMITAALAAFAAAVRWETKLEGHVKEVSWALEMVTRTHVPTRQRNKSMRGLSQIGFDLWSMNGQVVVAAETDPEAWEGTTKVWWLMTLGAAHAWLYIGSSRISFRPHQRVLVVAAVIGYVLYISGAAIATCDDYLTTSAIVEEHMPFVCLSTVPGSCVFTLLCLLFTASPLSLVSKAMYESTPSERVHVALGTRDVDHESVRLDLRLRPEELQRVLHHEVLGRRLHCAISVALLRELRDSESNKLLDLNDIDFDSALLLCKQSWLRKDGFVAWYAREEENILWVAGLKAMAAHDFQLAAALFHLSLLSDNPDLFVVFNDKEPPRTAREVIECVLGKNIIGRMWVEHYAVTLLKMSKEQVYKCLLQSSVTVDEVVVLLGATHDDSLFDAQGSRGAMMCRGEVWSWLDGIRALRDDPRGPQVVEAAQAFCWAPQELCSYTMLNSTVITGPVDEVTHAFESGEGDAPFKPRHLVYGRLMVRYYCCMLSQLPGQPLTAEHLTPADWVQWTLEDEDEHLVPTQLPTLPPHEMPFRLPPPKADHIPNVYLTFLLNWKLAPVDQEVGTFCVASPLEPRADPFGPITRVNEIWKGQETGSRHNPIIGVEGCLTHLRKGNKVHLIRGVYPSLKLSRLRGGYHLPITFYGGGDVVFLSRGLGRRCAVWLDECSFLQWSGVAFENAVYGVDAASSYCISFTGCVFRRVHVPVNQSSDDVKNKCFDGTNEVHTIWLGPHLPTQMAWGLSILTYAVVVLLAAGFLGAALYRCFSISERHSAAWLILALIAVVQDLCVNQPAIVAVYLIGRRVFALLAQWRGKEDLSDAVTPPVATPAPTPHPAQPDIILPAQQAEEHSGEALEYSSSSSSREFELTPKARCLTPESTECPPVVETSPPVLISDA